VARFLPERSPAFTGGEKAVALTETYSYPPFTVETRFRGLGRGRQMADGRAFALVEGGERASPRAPANGAPAPRSRFDRWLLNVILRCGDLAVALAVAVAMLEAVSGYTLLSAPLGFAAPLLLAAAAPQLGLWASEAYDVAPIAPLGQRMTRVASGLSLGLAVAAALIWLAIGESAWEAIAALVAGALFSALLHVQFGYAVQRLARSGSLSETAIIVGATDAARQLIARAQATHELTVLGVFDDRLGRAPASVEGVPVVGTVDDLLNWDRLPDVDRIIVTVTSTAEQRVRDLIERLKVLPNRVVLLLDLAGVTMEPAAVGAFADAPAAFVSGGPHDARRAFAKRVQDLVLGTIILGLAAPIMAVIALGVRLTGGPGPVIFRQRRHGFNNRVITVYKFRSMRVAPTAGEGVRQVEANDPRVTKLGAFLRKTSLDELPQLINVLKGEMSLVGPRPHAIGMRTGEVESHLLVAEYAHRHRMKPGMTGWAQINGSRGPLDTADDVAERVRLDLEYIDRASFWFDVWIMLRTLPALLGDKLRVR
jgi:Undecaprenyl-phosphate glucose phosphotransferase